MYYLTKREFKKDRLKILVLGIIIGVSIGISAGFLLGTKMTEDIILTGWARVPQRMGGIQF